MVGIGELHKFRCCSKLKRHSMKVKSKLVLILMVLLVTFFDCRAQHYDAKQLLDKIDKAVNSFRAGQYILHDNHFKIAVGEDSTKSSQSFNCFFQTLPSDTLAGYQLASFRDDGYERVYDGSNLMTRTPWDETLEIIENTRHPEEIKKLKEDYLIFPFFKYYNTILQFYNKDTMLNKIVVYGIETHKGQRCYKLQAGSFSDNGKFKSESYYYVSASSFLPIGHYVRFEATIGQAKEIQIFNYWISDLKSGVVTERQFSKTAISAYRKEKPFNSSDKASKSQLLPIGAKAPEWQLPLISGGGNLRLSDLKGKVVILDFWYKACAPCQKQMIEIQKLHGKHSRDSVVFVGVNTIDDPVKDKLVLFLSKRNITMTSVYKGQSIETDYGVYASPALFVIDKNGQIVFTLDGYSDTLLDDLVKIIQQHL